MEKGRTPGQQGRPPYLTQELKEELKQAQKPEDCGGSSLSCAEWGEKMVAAKRAEAEVAGEIPELVDPPSYSTIKRVVKQIAPVKVNNPKKQNTTRKEVSA